MNIDPLDVDKTMLPDDGGNAASLQPGITLGQYRIIKLLGRGGMGEVYEVEHQVLHRKYALKLLPHDFMSRSGAMERFQREAEVMANLEHKHIVKVDDFGDSDGRYWLRMELVEGQSLQDYADSLNGKIPQEELLEILNQIVDGLAYAHGHGAIHRDLKPSNILLSQQTANHKQRTASLTVKIADFGLVRLVGEEWVRSQAQISVQRSLSMGDDKTMGGEGTSTRSMLGTYEYMSPEQKRGEEADERSDIYSLGLMTFKLLTGRGLGMKAPSQIDEDLAPAWDAVVSDALEEDPNDRPSDCGKFAEHLSSVADEIAAQIRQRQQAEQEDQKRRDEAAEKERHRQATGEAAKLAEEHRLARESREQQEKKQEGAERREREAAEAKRKVAEAESKPKRRGRKWIAAALVLVAACGLAYWGWSSRAKPSESRLSVSASKAVPVVTRFAHSTGPKFGDTKTVDLGGGVNLKLVWIPAGEFRMGSPASEQNRSSDEGPQHRVTISKGFWMGKTEVTQRQYKQVMGKNPSSFKQSGMDAPVEQVSWNNAKDFCRKLSQQIANHKQLTPAHKVRLPTEAEWEYACRAGSTTRFGFGGSDSDLHKYGNYCDRSNTSGYSWQDKANNDGHDKTAPVGSYRPNAWGLHDMHGNVWEWCEDRYDKNYYGSSPGTDPKGPGSGSARVLRGGSWVNDARYCRSAYRRSHDPEDANNHYGFRIVVVH